MNDKPAKVNLFHPTGALGIFQKTAHSASPKKKMDEPVTLMTSITFGVICVEHILKKGICEWMRKESQKMEKTKRYR